jgi:hypothetical protein
MPSALVKPRRNHLAGARFLRADQGILALCEPYGPVHSFKLVHNRGTARVACIIELESTKDEPALARALGGRSVNGSVCVEFEVAARFGRAARGAGSSRSRLRPRKKRIAAP